MASVVAHPESSRSIKAAATRDTLLRVARAMFEERGYFEIGTPELVAAAGLTRGALYHHFENKFDLFVEVFRIAEKELFEEALGLFDPAWVTNAQRLRNGSEAYLKAVASSTGRQRIMLIDGPVVLGWTKWREMKSVSFRSMHEQNIRSLMKSGKMRLGEPQYVSQLLIAAMNEGSLAIAHAAPSTRDAVRVNVTASLMLLIDGLLTLPVSSD